jgi:hypothetical protein
MSGPQSVDHHVITIIALYGADFRGRTRVQDAIDRDGNA